MKLKYLVMAILLMGLSWPIESIAQTTRYNLGLILGAADPLATDGCNIADVWRNTVSGAEFRATDCTPGASVWLDCPGGCFTASQWTVKATQNIISGGEIDCSTLPGQSASAVVTVIGYGGAPEGEVAEPGPVVALGDPQIIPGTSLNPSQWCLLKGTDAVNTVTLVDGDGVTLSQAGASVILDNRTTISLLWDGVTWVQVGQVGITTGTSSGSLQDAHAVGAVGGFTSLPPTRPFSKYPEGVDGVGVHEYGESGAYVKECYIRIGDVTIPCQPPNELIRPGQSMCLLETVLDDPATRVCLERATNVAVDGIGIDLELNTSRGLFVDRPTVDLYKYKKYLVVDCLDASCTAGGGTLNVEQVWKDPAWVNIGAAGSGTIAQVWSCVTGDCSALTAASGDTLDAGSATSIRPATRSTSVPGTCTEGQLHQDTNSGGSELYICTDTATNTWAKLQIMVPWEVPFSAAGLVVDGTNCVTQTKTQINSGWNTFPVACNDTAPGTLELGFLSPTFWDGTPLTVKFVIIDPSTSGAWSVNVEAMCRTPGIDTQNNTWGTPVAATVTLTSVNIPYIASATVTPNTACAGGDWVSIRATTLQASTHTDTNANIVGGVIVGSRL